MFFAVVRFSPPSQENEAVKRKAEAKNNSPDSQEPIFDVWLRPRAKPEAALGFFVSFVVKPKTYLSAVNYCFTQSAVKVQWRMVAPAGSL